MSSSQPVEMQDLDDGQMIGVRPATQGLVNGNSQGMKISSMQGMDMSSIQGARRRTRAARIIRMVIATSRCAAWIWPTMRLTGC